MLEKTLAGMSSVTDHFAAGETPEELMRGLLGDIEVEGELTPRYHCNCSRDRVTKALISLGRDELDAMIAEGKPVTLHCDFCNKDYTFETLNNKLGYITQKAVIFTGSVKDNVSYGETDHKVKEEDIKEAIKIAQAEEFVSKLDGELKAHVARGGTNLSGGQKQRLSIARAIARKPEIYIFDDTFSALDYKTDLALRKELKKYTKDATSLIVAQRIGTIMNADKILVLDNGKCVGMGTHKELLKSCEVYKEIALSQLSEEELQNA